MELRVSEHKSPLHDSLQRVASELAMEWGQGNKEGEAGAER